MRLPDETMKRYRIVIDTDAGADDLMAIAFLLGRPDVEITGITVTTGLSSMEEGARNILRLLTLTNAGDIPVYMGSPEQLKKTTAFPKAWMDASETAGRMAAGVEPLFFPRTDAVGFLAGILTQKNSNIQILALGPLTNIALALRAANKHLAYSIRTVIMGGAVYTPGNLNLRKLEFEVENDKAEWNFYSDPLAASEVLRSPLAIELVPLDATRTVKLDSCFINQLKAETQTPNRDYVGRILNSVRARIDQGTYHAWDPLAAVVLVCPQTVQFENAQLSVTVSGPYEGQTQLVRKGKKIKFARLADADRFAGVFSAGLRYHAAASTTHGFFCRKK